MAQNYANKLAAENKFEHSDSQAGENLYMEYSSGPLPMTSAMAEEAISSWYNEIETYDYSLGPRSPGMTGIEIKICLKQIVFWFSLCSCFDYLILESHFIIQITKSLFT